MKSYKYFLITLFFILPLSFYSCNFQKGENKETSEIQENSRAYAAAYKERNIDALMRLWTDDGFYINSETGYRLQGKEEIKKNFEEMFSNYGDLTIQISVDSIDTLDDDHAVQKGTARVTVPGRLPMDSKYTVYYIRENGHWLIQNVVEREIRSSDSENEKLNELAWIIGKWSDQDPTIQVVNEAKWDYNNHFIKNTFSLEYKGERELFGEQIIGWDSYKKQIRSWIFDSEGGIGEGIWSIEGNKWIVHVTSILPGGEKASSIHIYTLLDIDTYKFQVIGREINGRILPHIEEVSIIRKKSS